MSTSDQPSLEETSQSLNPEVTEQTVKPTETEEQMRARHRKEAKELVAKTTAMKKQATKGEKKKRKEINKQIETLEKDMKFRHQDELNDLIKLQASLGSLTIEPPTSTNEPKEDEDDDEDDLTRQLLAQIEEEERLKKEKAEASKPKTEPVPAQPKVKRDRRKERYEAKQAAKQKIIEEAEAEAANQIDYRKIEIESLNNLLALKNLSVFEVPADGHCLFNSIADQLRVRHNVDKTVQELRTEAANHIRAHPNDFSPFLFDEATMSIRDVNEYTKELETTPLWGGDLEITAYSQLYNCPVSILIAGQSPILINAEGTEPELKLAYYKHSFGLGEHYNSVRG